MLMERFDFPNANGLRLAAVLDRPSEEPAAFALIAHCFTCGKDNLAASRIAQALAARSVAVLRFDFTGSVRARASSQTPGSPQMSPISSPLPTICGERIARRHC
jgi:predicted alpha/beta-hydrolase family hydrolase